VRACVRVGVGVCVCKEMRVSCVFEYKCSLLMVCDIGDSHDFILFSV
jgi:hypothetical protein